MATPFWCAVHGRFMPSVKVATLPASLLERFLGPEPRSRLVHMLRVVCPLAAAALREIPQLDEKLYLELFTTPRAPSKSRRVAPAESPRS